MKFLFELVWCSGAQLIEEVVVAFFLTLRDDSRFFQQIMRNESASNAELASEMNLDELAEATAVVIASRLRITKRFQQGICYRK